MSQQVDISQVNLVIANIGATTKTITQLQTDYPNAKAGQEVHADTELYKCLAADQWHITRTNVVVGQGLSKLGDGTIYLGLRGQLPTETEVNLTNSVQNMVVAYPFRNLHWAAQTSFVFEVQCTDVNTFYQMVFYKTIGSGSAQEIGTITRNLPIANQWDRITETFMIVEDGQPFSTGEQYSIQMTAKRLSGTGTVKIRRLGIIEICN